MFFKDIYLVFWRFIINKIWFLERYISIYIWSISIGIHNIFGPMESVIKMASRIITNISISYLVAHNVFGSPFMSSGNSLSLHTSQLFRLSTPFFYNTKFTELTGTKFKNSTASIFANENCYKYYNYISDSNSVDVSDFCVAFFDCCEFSNVGKAISADNSDLTLKIRKSIFIGFSASGVSLISVPKNNQVMIEMSSFTYKESSASSDGIFISSNSASSTYFSIKDSFFCCEIESSILNTRDTILSNSEFHHIYNINMTDINIDGWGSCLGLSSSKLFKLTFSKFVNNSGKCAIWIWNLPESRYQDVSNNMFLSITGGLFFVNDLFLVKNSYFDSDYESHLSTYGNGTFSIVNPQTLSPNQNPPDLTFDVILGSGDRKCDTIPPTPTASRSPEPTGTPPPPSKTPTETPTKSATASQTPTQTAIITQSPTQSAEATQSLPPPSTFYIPTPTASRTPRPSATPYPSKTPTQTPPYGPIVGLSAAAGFIICVIIALIIFFVRELRHKSSEDTIDDMHGRRRISGNGEISYSSETDPLELNSSSTDSFDMY
ncbi:hypothetical protein TRFO_29496 [Tritrichomonas foetus]|uniref:Uncharacterized protein n=1 Tax=Tritrichomonas foetus TaxID=1144522 RepID=A0A1J4K0C7_9EUKA|nr:hypothetical protein TRFO_29496 [Tritrichomonas foetus]|eukprot:OHT03190.1 hypothetical protein TRFO_29496 [Tritrichomonas foetus]